jgi:glutathione-regulated potassium-efflux system ancillary protein KefF
MIVVVFAHPYPDRSLANRALLEGVGGLDGVTVRSLYDLYPDFAIDAEAERDVLEAASTVVWQHPMHWYSVPALLKLWFERVLVEGWAWGGGGTALRGKSCLWAVTTGGDERDYSPGGLHGHAFETFTPVVRQTAEFCGMTWLPPFVVPRARQLDAAALRDCGRRYRARLVALGAEEADRDG